MPQPFITNTLKQQLPDLVLGIIRANVVVNADYKDLQQIINDFITKITTTLSIEEIAKMPAIASSRQAYKKLGQDPSRYRLSAEALLRRIAKGMELYNSQKSQTC